MVDTAGLRALISEYDRLRSLDSGAMSARVRGMRFNGFIADVLRAWGIEARASTSTPAGEIDVMFSLDGQRYIVEAKWERSKTDLTPLSKLGTRLRQRMRGTNGVFVSMAGYMRDALTALPEAGGRSILLFDRSHVEAMVSGLVAPDELLRLALDHAAYTGEAYVPVLTLLAPTESTPAVTFDLPSNGATQPLVPGIAARVTCAISGAGLVGLAPRGPGKLLVVGEEGIAEVDHVNRVATWRAPVRGCHGNPVLLPDGSIMFARRHGIGICQDFLDTELLVRL
jgi:Holliday junction resolvase-like predicted endonuclease